MARPQHMELLVAVADILRHMTSDKINKVPRDELVALDAAARPLAEAVRNLSTHPMNRLPIEYVWHPGEDRVSIMPEPPECFGGTSPLCVGEIIRASEDNPGMTITKWGAYGVYRIAEQVLLGKHKDSMPGAG